MPLPLQWFRSPYVVFLQQLRCVCCAQETPVYQRSGRQRGPHLACASFQVFPSPNRDRKRKIHVLFSIVAIRVEPA